MLFPTRSVCRTLPLVKKIVKNVLGTNKFVQNQNHQRLLSSTPTLWDRRYSDKHEWVSLNGQIATVGISQYAQEALGDVVYAQLPDVGSVIKQKEECGALESVKAASEVYSPVSGTVVEKNAAVEETPALVNQSCYEKGWLFKVEISEKKELDELMTDAQYQEFLKADHH